MFYNKIETVHLEITDKCNAACPQCARNIFGGKVNPLLPLIELKLNDIKKIFPIEFVQSLKKIYLCGNYGDPIVARDTLEIFKWFQEVNPNLILAMHTNGSAKKSEWWTELGKVLKKPNYVRFGLDGLEDTNHIYRRNTNWSKILENVKAFIATGGNAEWDFIVFKHNEHQIEEARQLSKDLGFTKFQVKKTGRFFSNNKMEGIDRQPVKDANNNILYYLEKPENKEYQNDALLKESKILEDFGSMQEYLDQTKINCAVLEDKSLYVSAEGLVFPCCWTANQMYIWYSPKTEITEIVKKYGKDSINALKNPIIDITNGYVFKEIKESWEKESIAGGKIKVCAKTCGLKFNQFKKQFE